MDSKLIATALSAMLCSSAHAVTVFTPIDATINFVELFGGTTALIGLFDDSDQNFAGGHLLIQASGDQAIFTSNGADYDLTNVSGLAPDTFSLSDSNRFTLAAWSPDLNTWNAPDAVYCSAMSGSCSLSWSGLLVELAVDLTEVPPHTSIPLPSSVTLLGLGLFGLVVVGRRRIIENP